MRPRQRLDVAGLHQQAVDPVAHVLGEGRRRGWRSPARRARTPARRSATPSPSGTAAPARRPARTGPARPRPGRSPAAAPPGRPGPSSAISARSRRPPAPELARHGQRTSGTSASARSSTSRPLYGRTMPKNSRCRRFGGRVLAGRQAASDRQVRRQRRATRPGRAPGRGPARPARSECTSTPSTGAAAPPSAARRTAALVRQHVVAERHDAGSGGAGRTGCPGRAGPAPG